MKYLNFFLMFCVSFLGASGCAPLHREGADKIFYEQSDPLNPGAGVLIIEKNNDLYLRAQNGADMFFRTTYTERRLTNTSDIKETNVNVWLGGVITYFSQDADGGHWYMIPSGGDDRNRKEVSADTILKMGNQYQPSE